MQYELEKLNRSDFELVWEIMQDSFPVDERRNRAGQEYILSHPCYQLYGCRKNGGLAAFFAVWEFEEFSFVEHFAVAREYRNGGIGAALLQQLLETIKKPVVLEVEPPERELQRRRIGFYERNGFRQNPYAYIQPAMSEEGRAIPLKLLSTPEKLGETEFERIRDVLYQQVYQVR